MYIVISNIYIYIVIFSFTWYQMNSWNSSNSMYIWYVWVGDFPSLYWYVLPGACHSKSANLARVEVSYMFQSCCRVVSVA